MKKFFVLLVAIVALGFAANAQDAIGVRFGGGAGYGAELSYQKGLGSNRLEFDLGVSNFGGNDMEFNLAGAYHWSFNIVDNLNWYVGPGLNLDYCSNHGFGLGICGQIGIEYRFSFPLMVSIDARPTYRLLVPQGCGMGNFGWGACAAVRYCF
ncbi:MAG: hypothetical protein MJZ86_09960 [Bacteroidales bacterium]|nr:hypothetical protein [Bacteroidales bacterium]